MTQDAGIIDSRRFRPATDFGPGITLFEQDIVVQDTAAPRQASRPSPKLELVAGPAPASHIERRAADESLVPPDAVEVLRVYAHAQHAGIRSLVLAQPAGFAVPFEGASGEPRFGLWGAVLAQAVREIARGAALTTGKHEGAAFDEIVDGLLKGLFEDDAPAR